MTKPALGLRSISYGGGVQSTALLVLAAQERAAAREGGGAGMNGTTTLEDLAVVGRRLLFTRFRELGDGPEHPGIITGLETGDSGALRALIRIDGTRSTLSTPVDYEGLTYLDEVVDVPDLPMGPFTPVADDRNAIREHDGVLYAQVGEDGEWLVVITDDLAAAKNVARWHAKDIGLALDEDDLDAFEAEWSVFEWQPENAECPWTVRPAEDGEILAVHTYGLYA